MNFQSNILTLGIVLVLTRPVWTNESWALEWRYESVRKMLNKEILIKSINATDHVHCSVICSSLQLESLFYVPSTGMCYCNRERDNCIETSTAELILYGLQKTDGGNIDHLTLIPGQDCLDFHDQGCAVDGIYPIIGWDDNPTPVQCDMTGGGWTIIQQRFDGSVDFRRAWLEYRLGFGNISGEYWIGLENIHKFTVQTSELIIYAEMFPGVTPASMTAHYGYFKVGSHSINFRLSVAGFNGTCGDSLAFSNGFGFSTFDKDHDATRYKHCARLYHGGWWYMHCHWSSMNGIYFQPADYHSVYTKAQGLHWLTCWGWDHSAMASIMKIKRITV